MQKLITAAVLVMFSCFAVAETIKTDSMSYGTNTQQPTEIKLPNGSTVYAGWESTSRLVRTDGVESQQYCHGDGVEEADGTQTTAGFCAVVADNGDILWVWFRSGGQGSEGTWGVIEGTGQYAGATGGGTTTPVSQRGDGRSGTMRSVGSITTK